MTKRNVEAILQFLLDTIKPLSEDQLEKLLAGGATLQYTELAPISDPFEQMREVIYKTQDIKEIEQVLMTQTKKSLVAFCRYFQIATKSADTKAILLNKIAIHFGKNTFDEPEESNEFQDIQQQLEKIETIKDGKTLINNHGTLQTKVNLIKLAKSLNVYVDPNNKKKEIQSRIVESIVGARLRGKGIRER